MTEVIDGQTFNETHGGRFVLAPHMTLKVSGTLLSFKATQLHSRVQRYVP
jgi:hypothetical protein